jgi:hypothetical protein
MATNAVPAASSDRRGVAANSLFWNTLSATSYSTIFCEQFAAYAIANRSEISTLPRVRKKRGRGYPSAGPNLGQAARHLMD